MLAHTRRLSIGLVVLAAAPVELARIGSVFVTGHDPDFHASIGGNALGAQHINQAAISFITDPLFNQYYAGGATKFLYVQSNIAAPSGHTDGKLGIIASGYTEGVDFDHHDASTLDNALNQIGTVYSGIVVCSDFGGLLTQAELDILNTRVPDIFTFVNSGGGIYAMAESNSQGALTPNGGHFDFIPTIVSSTQLNQGEAGFTVTPFGMSLGLADSDVNDNASHNIFLGAGNLMVVDYDAAGNIMSLAGRVDIPAPMTIAPIAAFMLVFAQRRRG